MNLIQYLQTVRDYRTQPDYPLWVILVLVVMGTRSGCPGYRALADFVNRHQATLLEVMNLPYTRLPSLSTLRRILVRVDFVSFTEAFNQWAQAHCAPAPGEPVPIAGKGIKASLRDYDQADQDLVSIVAAFSDSVITVKGNQQTLFAQLKRQFEPQSPVSINRQSERIRDRVPHRTVSVLDQIPELDPRWVGIQRLIRVARTGTRAGKPSEEIMFYSSSLRLDAVGFAQGIRAHWQIENRLHWVKDVVLKEDQAPVCDGNAPINFAIARTLGLNLFRMNGFDSITKGLRFLAHDIKTLFSFFQ